ncbi:MAG TPA: hypothetical protein VM493_06600 [Vicinamibacterales bacterium]|nr:hypothetical protein [Vicinamibacterales bacterium]
MTLSDVGESRVRGYLYVLERTLRSSASLAIATDAIREVESHIRDRVADSPATPNERDALESILTRLGSPATVARAYSLELMMEEAEVGGRLVAVLRSLFHTATTSLKAFAAALMLFTAYTMGAGFIATALLKPIFPNNVGLWVHEGFSLGAQFPAPPGVTPLGGYWIIPICMVLGLVILLVTHRMARRWIASLRGSFGRRSDSA